VLAIVAGSPKCGTSWFRAIAARHPKRAAGVAHKKEPYFFTSSYANGLKWYLSLVPGDRPGWFAIDASPGYLYQPRVAIPRIKESFPDTTIVLLLREPVSRAFSHWRFHRKPQRRLPLTTASFAGYAGADLKRIETEGIPSGIEHDCAKMGCSKQGAHIVAIGAYVGFVRPWLDAFGDRIFVYFFEDLVRDPKRTMGHFFKHLGLSPKVQDAWLQTKKFRSSFQAERCVEMDERLQEFYRPHNRKLAKILGRELPKAWQY